MLGLWGELVLINDSVKESAPGVNESGFITSYKKGVKEDEVDMVLGLVGFNRRVVDEVVMILA